VGGCEKNVEDKGKLKRGKGGGKGEPRFPICHHDFQNIDFYGK